MKRLKQQCTQKKILKHTSERKRKIGIETENVTTTGEGKHAFPPAKGATKNNKRVRDGSYVWFMKNVATVEIEVIKDKFEQGVKSTVMNQVNSEESWGSPTSERQINNEVLLGLDQS